MRLRDVVSMAVCALAFNSAYAQSAPTIASTSLCGDSYLLAIAPEQISALSWQSRDPLSQAAEKYRELPQVWDDPEVLASLKAEVVLFGPGEGLRADKILKSQNIKRVDLVWGEDFETVVSNVKTIGEAVHSSEMADQIVSDLEARLSALRARSSKTGIRPKILYLSRAGGSAGTGTLVDTAIRAAGGENVLTSPGWVTLETEVLISLKPDLVITSFFEEGYESVNASGLRHSAVKSFLDQYPQLKIPGHLWPCAGPSLIEAAELIHSKLDQLG